MNNQRLGRVADAIQRDLSDILRGLKDPRVGFVSITNVEMSKDLRHAKVFVSILGSDSEVNGSMAGLKSAIGHIRSELAGRLQLRFVPDLTFVKDHSIQYSSRISALIEETKQATKSPSED